MELDTNTWAAQQWASVDLGDQRLNRRALRVGTKMAAQPGESLPGQMGSLAELKATYRFMSNPRVEWTSVVQPHCSQTLREARQTPVVLMIQDGSHLDYTAHAATTGLGPIGDHRGRGLILHSTLAVRPDERRVLGLANLQIFVRPSSAPAHVKGQRRQSPEGQAWEHAAQQIGAPPAGVMWVHVSDRESDVYDYLAECVQQSNQFLVRAYKNRRLGVAEPAATPEQATFHLLDHIRACAAVSEQGYTLALPAHDGQPARQARLALVWETLRLRPPVYATERGELVVSIVRAWEPDPPAGVDAVEWLLLSSLPVHTIADALRLVHWYECRWLIEDFHMCLKTGCGIERSQLDQAADLQRLIAFAAPIAVRLLQLRQDVRHMPAALASTQIEPLMLTVLARKQNLDSASLSLAEFWRRVARLGGHLGRKSDGPPGWRTLWKGWRLLSTLTEGARLALSP
jgi:Transposase DNA-binding/Transposase Tn5 dimerisation domain